MTWQLFALLIEASGMTLLVSAVAIFAGLGIAILLSGARMSGHRLARAGVATFVSFFRGVPLLVQLLLLFNLLPALGINLSSLTTALIGLTLCTAAYQAENLRGGFEAVPAGLIESADMLGFTPAQTFLRIRVPIALRLTFPTLVSEAILILKASSLVSVVGVIELTKMASNLAASTFMPVELYAAAGLIYLAINTVVGLVGRAMERRLPGTGVPRPMTFDFGVIFAAGPEILAGLMRTILIWIAGTAMGVVLGFVIATLRRYGGLLVNLVLGLPVEVLRGTPFLVQLFLLYFGGPFIGLSLDPIPAGLLALTLYGSAYFSEIFRTGYQSVPDGHVEAADCLGFTRSQTIRVLLPEMALIVLPPAVNMTVILLKETALLSLITVPELTLTVQAIGSQQYAFLEALFVLALTYWALVELAGLLGRRAEGYFSRYRTART